MRGRNDTPLPSMPTTPTSTNSPYLAAASVRRRNETPLSSMPATPRSTTSTMHSPMRHGMVPREPVPVKPSARVAEMVGGTAAGCAAVCCCCPCAVLDFVVLAVVKVPTGLMRRAMRARRRKIAAKRKKEMAALEYGKEKLEVVEMAQVASSVERASPEEVARMEMEVWAPFYGAGFWRSPSQKETR